MPRTKKTQTVDPRDIELNLLREQVAKMSVATASHVSQLAQKGPQSAFSNVAYVGIRNVSDNTIGIPGQFGEPDIHLHADLGGYDPASVTAIPYAWWLRLRTGALVRDGLIVRDDAVLGEGYMAAPVDRPEDLPTGWEANHVPDPEGWILDRNEEQIRADLGKMTSEAGLRRVRRGVDIALKRLQDKFGPETPNKAAAAWQALPMKYRLVDELTTHRLERPEDFTTSRG